MALFFADLVREACRATGAGNLALDGALPGHRSFAAAVPEGERFHYAIAGITHADEWETGEGEIVGGLLVRDPIASSAGGAAVNLSTGLKTVALTVGADWFAARDGGVAAMSDISGLEEALAGKAAGSHGHAVAEVSGLQAALDGKASAAHNHDAAYQPLDADLSAIASLATSPFGRAQLALADAAALRGHAGLGSIAVQAAGSVSITGGSISGIADLAVSDGGTGASSASAARANLGLGSAAVKDFGTSGDVVPLLGGAATSWAAGASFGGGLAVAAGCNVAGNVSLTTNATYLYARKADGGVTRIAGISGADTCYLGPIDLALQTVINAAGGLVSVGGSVAIAGTVSIGANQVLSARRTGWAVPSGTAARTSFDTAGVTTEALAQRVKALIDDLTSHGLIGS